MSPRPLPPAVPIACLALFVAALAGAQTAGFLGVKGTSCVAIPPGGGNHVVTLTGAIAAGSEVFVIVGAAQNIPLADPISDNQANVYQGEVASFSDPIITKTFAGPILHALSAGHTVTVAYTDNSTGLSVTSCAIVAAFSKVSAEYFSSNNDSSFGSANTSLHSNSVNTTGDVAEFAFVAAFATGSATGGLSGFSPFSAIPAACSGGFCVNPFYRFVGATGSYHVDPTSAAAVIWSGDITAHRDGTISTDGFETGDLTGWDLHNP
jgi:hypothetical protein